MSNKEINLSEDDIDRFWSKVDARSDNECWEWKAGRYLGGYGRFLVNNVNTTAHRVSWMIANGREPLPGYEICHVPKVCHNRRCCNPYHLDEKTPKQNAADREIDETTARGERNGTHTHPESVARGDRNGLRIHPEKAARGERNGHSTHPEKTPRGERNGRAKLTQADAEEIRKLRKQGLIQSVIASIFGVSRRQVSRIERGEQWKE